MSTENEATETIESAQARIGQRVVYCGRGADMASVVTVRGARANYGRIDYHVEDALGRLWWVDGRKCAPVSDLQR